MATRGEGLTTKCIENNGGEGKEEKTSPHCCCQIESQHSFHSDRPILETGSRINKPEVIEPVQKYIE